MKLSFSRGRTLVVVLLCLWVLSPVGTLAQTPPAAADAAKKPEEAKSLSEEEAQLEQSLAATPADKNTEKDQAKAEPVETVGSMNFLELLVAGGGMMIPIGGMFVLAVTFSIERFLALRRDKVLPEALTQELGKLSRRGGLDPRQVYRVCQQYPSAASNVIRAMLLKIGRPHAEVEAAVAEAREREGTLLFKNVRWLYLCVSVAPMLGLLGTVWGMIGTFYDTANLPEDANKLKVLAGGIYVALVTTFGGLVVAIPSAIVAHFYEGRIQALFHDIDELLLSLLPQVERYEGRLRVQQEHLSNDGESLPVETVEPPPKVAAREAKV